MHPVDEFAQVREQKRLLRLREAELREMFLAGQARLRSNASEVVIRQQKRRVFDKDLLPSELLNDPKYWRDSSSAVVTIKRLRGEDSPDGIVLIEPYLSPPRFSPAHAGATRG